MTELAFIDTETTGLDPVRHRIWEAAVILAHHTDNKLVVEDEWAAFVQLPNGAIQHADPTALRMTRFHERTWQAAWTDADEFSREFAHDTAARHLVGAVPSFDERRLDDLLRAHGQCPAWHYHLIDVEALAAGYLAAKFDPDDVLSPVPPWRSDDLAAALDVEVAGDERHTAMGDARLAMRIYAVVYGLEIVRQ